MNGHADDVTEMILFDHFMMVILMKIMIKFKVHLLYILNEPYYHVLHCMHFILIKSALWYKYMLILSQIALYFMETMYSWYSFHLYSQNRTTAMISKKIKTPFVFRAPFNFRAPPKTFRAPFIFAHP